MNIVRAAQYQYVGGMTTVVEITSLFYCFDCIARCLLSA